MSEHPVIACLKRNARMATLTAGLVRAPDGWRCVGCGKTLVSVNDSRSADEQIAAVDGHKCEIHKEKP